jgi:hypothetical protein
MAGRTVKNITNVVHDVAVETMTGAANEIETLDEASEQDKVIDVARCIERW